MEMGDGEVSQENERESEKGFSNFNLGKIFDYFHQIRPKYHTFLY